MPDICTVSFTARDTSFALLPNQRVVFRPVAPLLDSAGSVLRLRKAVTVTANGVGLASAALTPGPYVLEAQIDGQLSNVPCVVPDQATASIDECIAAVSSAAQSAVAIALLASGLPFFESRQAAQTSPTLSHNDYFLAPGVTAAEGLTVYRKMSTGGGTFSSSTIGPVFPASFMAPGSLGAPGLAVSGDADTGLFAPSANQLAAAVAGVQGWLLSTASLQVGVPITGLAVTQSRRDPTAGRLMKVGDFGLGGGISAAYPPETVVPDIDALDLPGGFYQTINTTLGDFPPGESPFGMLIQLRYDAGSFAQIWMSALTDTLYTRRRRAGDTPAMSPWRPLFSHHNIVGPVSQTAGVPTGDVIERGSNANGDFVRFADGLQICLKTVSIASVLTIDGALFRSIDSVWTYPAAFANVPSVFCGNTNNANIWGTAWNATATTVSVRGRSTVEVTGGRSVDMQAIGRWF